jgi:hypothetical protein
MKRRGLPGWANAMLPVDMEGAATLLGISRRLLVDVIKNYPHYERRGVKKVFYPEHISALREDLKCQGSSRSIGKEFSIRSDTRRCLGHADVARSRRRRVISAVEPDDKVGGIRPAAAGIACKASRA